MKWSGNFLIIPTLYIKRLGLQISVFYRINMLHQYKLVYFNGRGKAEPTRLLFAAAGVKYEDFRVDFSKWPEEKKKSPQGSLPYLVIDGDITVSQSMAINRYLANEFAMFGQNGLEALFIDEIVETCIAFVEDAEKPFTISDGVKKKDAIERFENEIGPRYLGYLETSMNTRTAGTETGFAIGSSISLADIMMFTAVESANMEGVISQYPRVKASRQKVMKNKGIAKWLKVRP